MTDQTDQTGQMDVGGLRALVRDVPRRWSALHFVHREAGDEIEAFAVHGELAATSRRSGHQVRERGAPPSPFDVHPLEPYWDNYRWSAMLDPYELSRGVDLLDIGPDTFYGRPVWRFTAVAGQGYEPICGCCPLLFGEASQRAEYGEDWRPAPGEVLTSAYDVALDAETGVIVDCRALDGERHDWSFTNEIVSTAAHAVEVRLGPAGAPLGDQKPG